MPREGIFQISGSILYMFFHLGHIPLWPSRACRATCLAELINNWIHSFLNMHLSSLVSILVNKENVRTTRAVFFPLPFSLLLVTLVSHHFSQKEMLFLAYYLGCGVCCLRHSHMPTFTMKYSIYGATPTPKCTASKHRFQERQFSGSVDPVGYWNLSQVSLFFTVWSLLPLKIRQLWWCFGTWNINMNCI